MIHLYHKRIGFLKQSQLLQLTTFMMCRRFGQKFLANVNIIIGFFEILAVTGYEYLARFKTTPNFGKSVSFNALKRRAATIR